jgi:hypothetical protein
MRAEVGLVKRVDMLRVMEGGTLDMTMFNNAAFQLARWDLGLRMLASSISRR